MLDGLALSRSTVDRAAERRADPQLLETLLGELPTAVLLVDGDAALVRPGGSGGSGGSGGGPVSLALVDPAAALAFAEQAWGEAPVEHLYLGHGPGEDPDGEARHHVALVRTVPRKAGAEPSAHTLPGTRWAGLREIGTLLDDTGAGLLTTTVALAHWHAGHRHCARCGAPTTAVQAGWARHCSSCGGEHYPRTDGAVIMAIVDDRDRLLLGRQARWPEKRYSCLAGFVEPGESLEAAVRREAWEEAGVVIGDVDYRGSQPWPFPASLMLGFRARALTTEVTVDGVELSGAHWWNREELALDVATGEVLLPPSVSIARHLIEDWYGGPLRDDGGSWR